MPLFDVGKTVGERWRALTDQQRQPYLDLVAEQAAVDDQESDESDEGELDDEDEDEEEREHEELVPLSAFSSSAGGRARPSRPSPRTCRYSTWARRSASGVTDQQRQPYLDLAEQDKQRYAERLGSWANENVGRS